MDISVELRDPAAMHKSPQIVLGLCTQDKITNAAWMSVKYGNKVLSSSAEHILPRGEPEFEHLLSVSVQSFNQKFAKSTVNTVTWVGRQLL